MSTVAEIEAVLDKLSNAELLQVKRALHRQFLLRGETAVYQDEYGTVTEADLIASADAAFQEYDREEAEHARRKAR
jgi:hypothetical protein